MIDAPHHDPEAAFAEALTRLRARDLAGAEALLRQVPPDHPRHAESLYRLGGLAIRAGAVADGIALIEAALEEARPEQRAEFHLGAAFGRRRAGAPEGAAEHYRQALLADPGSTDALLNLAAVLRQLGRLDQAVVAGRAAVAGAPGDPMAAYNLGLVLADQGDLTGAAELFERAAGLAPGFPPASSALAAVLVRLGRAGEARTRIEAALARAPGQPELLNTLGLALQAEGLTDKAAETFAAAVAARPDYRDALYNLAGALRDQGLTDEAVAGFAEIVAHDPDFAPARMALAMARLPPLYADEGEIGRRRDAYMRGLDDLAEVVPGALTEGVGASQPFYLPYQGRDDLDLQRRYGGIVSAAMAARYSPAPAPPAPGPGEKIRVGFVSGFFRRHANWSMPIRGWLFGLDRGAFELFGYHTAAGKDDQTEVAAGLCSRFVQGPLTVERWRAEIATDAPHVLIYPEVGMDPMAVQLAAQRLAPVQCNSWGHPETSGLPTLDYFLSSALMEPPGAEAFYSERLVRLPNLSVLCEPTPAPTVRPTRARLGLGEAATLFWCGQSLYKYLPQHDGVFAAIAAEVPDAEFAFLAFPGSPRLTERFLARLHAAFAAQGLGGERHVRMLPRLDADAYAAATGLADVVLDSIGWSGCNSLFDAVGQGRPIVAFEGDFMRGRHGAAILTRLGETRTIARSMQDFADIAVRLARDAAFRTEVAEAVRAGAPGLFHDHACVAALEDFLKGAVRGERPS